MFRTNAKAPAAPVRNAPWQALLACFALCAPAQGADPRGLPGNLRDTGLFDESLRASLMEFSPRFPLWSDGAAKRRWLYLPPGSAINAEKADAWEFPRGTKLWKEFGHGDAIETRYIERGANGSWRYGSYVWGTDGEARLAPAAGIPAVPASRAPRGRYGIPTENDCRACHEAAPVPVLGFSALQLSHELAELSQRGVLRNLAAQLVAQPPDIATTDPVERAALGYLHGNCGHCHNDDGPLAVLELNLAQRVAAAPDAVRRSIIGVPSQLRMQGVAAGAPRIAPGHASSSVIALRMRSRDPLQQMPPLGTSLIDTDALALIAQWIESLPRR